MQKLSHISAYYDYQLLEALGITTHAQSQDSMHLEHHLETVGHLTMFVSLYILLLAFNLQYRVYILLYQ